MHVFFGGWLLLATTLLQAGEPPELAEQLPEAVLPQLEEILAVAAEASPRMMAWNLRVALAEEDRRTRGAGIYPSASFSGQYRYQEEDRNTLSSAETGERMIFTASVAQPLYHWGALRANRSVGQIAVALEENRLAEARRLLLNQLRGDYLRLILAHKRLDNQRRQIVLSAEGVARDEARFEAGLIAANAVGGTRAAHDRAVNQLERAEYEYATAVERFGTLAGLGEHFTPESVPLVVPAVPRAAAPPPYLAADYIRRGVDEDLRLVQIDQQIRQQELFEKIGRVRLRPRVNLVAGASQDEGTFTRDFTRRVSTRIYFGGVAVSWNIFDGYASRAVTRSAQVRQRQLQRERRETEAAIEQEVRRREHLLDHAARDLRFAEQGLESRRGQVRLAREDFEAGRFSRDQLNQAELQLAAAELSAYQARTDYFLAVAEFLSAIDSDPLFHADPRLIHANR
ncbi:MAG: TolC family protein [Puniceicoccaceae bacterium]|nr:MAG: TolC family protein [Puniceicoccaceae bacterium]